MNNRSANGKAYRFRTAFVGVSPSPRIALFMPTTVFDDVKLYSVLFSDREASRTTLSQKPNVVLRVVVNSTSLMMRVTEIDKEMTLKNSSTHSLSQSSPPLHASSSENV